MSLFFHFETFRCASIAPGSGTREVIYPRRVSLCKSAIAKPPMAYKYPVNLRHGSMSYVMAEWPVTSTW